MTLTKQSLRGGSLEDIGNNERRVVSAGEGCAGVVRM